MKYRCRPGVVYENICGARLLIPTHRAFEACPDAVRLSFPGSLVWLMLQKDRPLADVVKAFSILTKKSEAEAAESVQALVDELVKKGALIATEDEA